MLYRVVHLNLVDHGYFGNIFNRHCYNYGLALHTSILIWHTTTVAMKSDCIVNMAQNNIALVFGIMINRGPRVCMPDDNINYGKCMYNIL